MKTLLLAICLLLSFGSPSSYAQHAPETEPPCAVQNPKWKEGMNTEEKCVNLVYLLSETHTKGYLKDTPYSIRQFGPFKIYRINGKTVLEFER
jgi:hypothetical protein